MNTFTRDALDFRRRKSGRTRLRGRLGSTLGCLTVAAAVASCTVVGRTPSPLRTPAPSPTNSTEPTLLASPTDQPTQTATLAATMTAAPSASIHGSPKPSHTPAKGQLVKVGTLTADWAGSATLLADGRVLFAGGRHVFRSFSTGAEMVATAQLFDPKTRKLTATGSMTTARDGQIAVLLQDGRVLVAGGDEGVVDVPSGASAEIYDPKTGRFSPTGSMAVDRYGDDGAAVALLADGRVLLAGGADDPNGATAEIYDPKTGRFSPTGSMAVTRLWPATALLNDGRVLVAGGSSIQGGGDNLASAELYDPTTGTFTPTGDLQSGRFDAAAVRLSDGRVLIAGGSFVYDCPPCTGDSLDSAEIYDPATGTFTPTGPLAAKRDMPKALRLPDGRVLVLGGSDPGTSAEVYDPATGSFSTSGPKLPDWVSTATLLQDGTVLLTSDGDVYLYTP